MNAIELFNENDIPFLVNSSFTMRNKDEIPIFTGWSKNWAPRPGTCL